MSILIEEAGQKKNGGVDREYKHDQAHTQRDIEEKTAQVEKPEKVEELLKQTNKKKKIHNKTKRCMNVQKA
jgi:hypothetical protein